MKVGPTSGPEYRECLVIFKDAPSQRSNFEKHLS